MTTTYYIGDVQVDEHTIKVPLYWDDTTSNETIDLFARVLTPEGGENYPAIVYMQGGPGCPATRPVAPASGWEKCALKKYRIVYMDQRGTGRSTGLDRHAIVGRGTPEEQHRFMKAFRADSIVKDASALRQYLGLRRWSVIGQSYGGFIITHYLSALPDELDGVIYTGGLQITNGNVDDLYKTTYQLTADACHRYYSRFPDDEKMIRAVCEHVNTHEEYLPSGEKLTSERVRYVGMELGRHNGELTLHYLFEQPFARDVCGACARPVRLDTRFLDALGAKLSFASTPLYALMHETIYAIEGQATNWSADRMREQVEGMSAHADPADTGAPYYLTAEHIHRVAYRHDPSLAGLETVADLLAQDTSMPALYDLDVLRHNSVPSVAVAYTQDLFVPYVYSQVTANNISGLKLITDEKHHHDGIRHLDDAQWDEIFAHISQR